MKGILSDNDILGQMRVLHFILDNEPWREIWRSFNLAQRTMAELGLVTTSSDAAIWHVCQKEQIILITGNRNKRGPDSLEATIQSSNTPQSLPVFTIADCLRITHSRAYAERVVERLLEYLIDIDNFRGTGRLYLP